MTHRRQRQTSTFFYRNNPFAKPRPRLTETPRLISPSPLDLGLRLALHSRVEAATPKQIIARQGNGA